VPDVLVVLVVLLGSFAAATVGVGWIRAWAESRAILDIPNDRSSHMQPVPRGGGLAIVIIAPVGVILACALRGDPPPVDYLVAFLVVAAVGLIDDLRSLPSLLRLVVYAGVAAAFVLRQGGFTELWLPGGVVSLGTAGSVLAFLWVVGLTNAYNFMDGIDGIAGLQAVVAAVAWLLLGLGTSDLPVAALSASLAGASGGFLLHNWPPARVFMGDVGSATLGFSFAAMPLLSRGGSSGDLPILGFLVVWPFVLDAGFTFLRRLLAGENVLAPHRTHLYQRLVITGRSHAAIATLYGLLALTGAALALALAAGMGWIRPVAILAPASLFVALYVRVRAAEGAAARSSVRSG
jgi:UDP-N-acetylmuramyl pentapeptide phosphotransferase/UDP-N-acetylglucosamine-1-phosphate transferase